ncbi:MAG TPA: sensor histidine kinase [Rubrobacteraceae bacterium]|nr:sensor histidine kinase [Rubrobacteraceae bacterium]
MTEFAGKDKREFSWAAQALENRFEEILQEYKLRLEDMRSFLVTSAYGGRPLESRARALLTHAAGMLRSDVRTMVEIDEEVLRTIEDDPDAPVDAHPDEAIAASMALCRAATSAVVRDAPSGCSPGDVSEAVLRIQESIVGPMGRIATMAYSNYLMHKIHETQVAERRHFSRELHDRVAHSIAVVSQNLELYHALKKSNPEEAERKIERAGELAREAMTVARDISAALRGTSADESMEVALENLLKFTVGEGVEYEVSRAGDDKELPEHVRDQLYLIMREGIRNAVAHSGGQRIEVKLGLTNSAAVGVISDYGRGFDLDAAYDGDGVGLKSMRERAELLGGRLEIRSTPQSGTRVEVTIPLRQGR